MENKDESIKNKERMERLNKLHLLRTAGNNSIIFFVCY